MDLEMLKEVVPMLEQQLEASKTQRNWTQLERDTVQTFYDVTRKEVSELETSIAAKDRAMELMEDNHRVEVRVYVQKVKHLEYEHKNNLGAIEKDSKDFTQEEDNLHEDRVAGLKGSKEALKDDLKEKNSTNSQEIANVKVQHEKILQQMRDAFEINLKDLEEKCISKLDTLEDDLELRRKVDIHEIEERKNLHINDLMRNHERAFGQMKSYYNDITNDNLQLIKDLKSEVAEKKKKAVGIQKVRRAGCRCCCCFVLICACVCARVCVGGGLPIRESRRLKLHNWLLAEPSHALVITTKLQPSTRIYLL